MPNANLTVTIADYAPVKAALEAAADVVTAQPWELSEAIESLRLRLEELISDGEPDSGEEWKA